MNVVTQIALWFHELSWELYYIYLKVNAWIWPFNLAAPLIYNAMQVIVSISHSFFFFAEWIDELVLKLKDILSWSSIKSLIRGWLDGIEDALDWFRDWWYWVKQKVDDWWGAISVTVKGWIEAATQGFSDLVAAWDTFWNVTFPQWTSKLDTLKAEWDNFWTVTFPTLLSKIDLETWWNTKIGGIDQLIESKLKEWFPLYDDLMSLWEDIKAFFADPLQWAYDKLDEWFERFW